MKLTPEDLRAAAELSALARLLDALYGDKRNPRDTRRRVYAERVG